MYFSVRGENFVSELYYGKFWFQCLLLSDTVGKNSREQFGVFLICCVLKNDILPKFSWLYANRRKNPGKKQTNKQKANNNSSRKNSPYIIVKIPRPKVKKYLLVLADQLGFAAEQELLYFTDFRVYYAPGSSMRGQQRPDEGQAGICKTFYLSERQTAGCFCGCCSKSS